MIEIRCRWIGHSFKVGKVYFGRIYHLGFSDLTWVWETAPVMDKTLTMDNMVWPDGTCRTKSEAKTRVQTKAKQHMEKLLGQKVRLVVAK